MKIRRLYIGEMGIYRNVLMENISPKIVVIGGLNRSGKTTFLDILRHMPYGFPKNLRVSTGEYFVESDLEDENKEKISLRLNGLKEPQIIFQGVNRNIIDKELYGDIDKFTYSQLFTITLDELKKLNIKSEEEKLQAVLLGAGINDIVHIPKLIDNLRKDKEKIGGKNGNPNIKLFKPYYEKILSGMDAREEALKQVEIFAFKEEEQTHVNEEILFKEGEIDNIKEQALALEVLESYFDDYRTCVKMKGEIEILKAQKIDFDFNNLPSLEKVEALYEEYREVYDIYDNTLNNFYNVSGKGENNYMELLKFEDKIKYYIKNISGIKQKQGELYTLKNDFEINKEAVLKKMENVNSSFKNDYNKILNIEIDLINEDKLLQLSVDIKTLKEQEIQCNEALEAEGLQYKVIEKELKALRNSEVGIFLKNYLYTSIGILCISVIIYFISKALAAGLFITGVTSAALYYFIKQGNLNQINSSIMNLKLQLKAIESKQAIYAQKLENINVKQKEQNNNFKFYIESLNIEEEISPQGALQYFKDVKELKSKIISLESLRQKIDRCKNDLNLDLVDIFTLVKRFAGISEIEEDNIFRFSSELFQTIESLDLELEAAKMQNTAKQKLLNSKTKLLERLGLGDYDQPLSSLIPELIKQYKVYNCINDLQFKLHTIEKNINKGLSSDRISKAFKTIGKVYNLDKIETIDYLHCLLNIYPVKIEIQKDIQSLELKLKESISKLDKLKEKLQIIKLELNTLSTSDKLEQAQRLIDEGRLNLKPFAIKYSVLSAAENILETVQKDFLDNAKHKLLKGAGDIFSKITSGEYKAVLPGDNLLQADYKTVEADGKIEETTSMLSRGTGEQLYLSVRLNRIKGIKQKLPIIFDDPFVNFDDIHVKSTLELISEFGEENQIFILTCHAEVIKYLSDIREDVQYWKLNKGKLNLSNSGELVDHLTKI
jgi:uncharacterized protein YhaN